jgi:hypothetical protein
VAAAAGSMLVLGGLIVAIGGGVLDGQPTRLGPDLTATGVALVVVAGLSAWFGAVTKRRTAEATGSCARPPGVTEGAYGLSAPVMLTARQRHRLWHRPRLGCGCARIRQLRPTC